LIEKDIKDTSVTTGDDKNNFKESEELEKISSEEPMTINTDIRHRKLPAGDADVFLDCLSS